MLVQIKTTCMVESKKCKISTAAYTWQGEVNSAGRRTTFYLFFVMTVRMH